VYVATDSAQHVAIMIMVMITSGNQESGIKRIWVQSAPLADISLPSVAFI